MFKDRKLVLAASGLANPHYLLEQYQRGKTGSLGALGETVKISEKDFNEIIKERISRLDFAQLKKDAKTNYWQNMNFVNLPVAKANTERIFVPQLQVSEDIVAIDGTVIAYQGQRYNPLNAIPFTSRLVIFDATNPNHLSFVKTLPKTHQTTKLVSTKFDMAMIL